MSIARILVVDDEPKLVRLVTQILQAKGYEVFAAASGDQAIEIVALEQPNLVILDIVLLGNLDGYGVANRIREFSDIPIIMLTAKVRESDMLQGFDSGVDDFITKPFNSKELLARISAVLKRSRGNSTTKVENEIICGDVIIDILRRKVTIREFEIHLTPTEYNLLYQLATHPNQVMLHEQLLNEVWGEEYRNDFDYLRSYIHNLRKKIEVDPSEPQIIVRSPGVGYMLVVEE
jgi:two-component system KDP operon response regulator KdpE